MGSGGQIVHILCTRLEVGVRLEGLKAAWRGPWLWQVVSPLQLKSPYCQNIFTIDRAGRPPPRSRLPVRVICALGPQLIGERHPTEWRQVKCAGLYSKQALPGSGCSKRGRSGSSIWTTSNQKTTSTSRQYTKRPRRIQAAGAFACAALKLREATQDLLV